MESTTGVRFSPTTVSADTVEMRAQVREFLAAEMPENIEPGIGIPGIPDRDFSQKLASRGWVGMALPQEYGGHGTTAVERFVVTEELLAARAPVIAHWVADRQTGPTILLFGTEDQRRRFLPAIARGECGFSLGMSEPDSGSDLASVRTAAVRVDGGWKLNGTKIWTTGAHHAHFMVVLCRTSPRDADRHSGLSQLIVDLSSPGATVSPIPFMDGTEHFNEVLFEDVFVPDDMVLGEIGAGWNQVTSELAYERSGPERFLSPWQLLVELVRENEEGGASEKVVESVGRLAAKYWAIRQMSLSVAASIDAAQAPATEAALVKHLGTRFEQEVIEIVRSLVEGEPSKDEGTRLQRLLASAILVGPASTVRGGTTEVLSSVAARGLMKS